MTFSCKENGSPLRTDGFVSFFHACFQNLFVSVLYIFSIKVSMFGTEFLFKDAVLISRVLFLFF